MNSRFPRERRDYIKKKLLAEKRIDASDIAALFEVSSETVRRDLVYLEEEGIAKRGYGGAVLADEHLEPSYIKQDITCQKQNERIARAAINVIRDGMSLLMDAGDTVFMVAKLLGMKKNVSVFTNAPRTALMLDDIDVRTYIFGGEFCSSNGALTGAWTVNAISMIRADIAIIGTEGFYGRQGPCAKHFDEVEIKKTMIQNSNQVIVVGDSSKANTNALIQYCLWEDVDVFITDDGLSDEVKEKIEQKTHVLIA